MNNKQQLIDELVKNEYKKNKIKSIAQKYGMKETELKKFYSLYFFSQIAQFINLDQLTHKTITEIEQQIPNSEKQPFDFIKNDLKLIIKKSLYVATMNGFSVNINHLNSGVMTANAGDSAEFIFIARAILAGFNCSSVDVRSSSYDAIIDYNNRLLRVQIKGISSGNIISFKDRDRGGQGIDHTHQSNKGRRITTHDCNIYVAVDKQVGICYIISMSWADKIDIDDDACKNVKLDEVLDYKENWDIIKQNA